MAERFSINMITPTTQDWTCKVQVVDKCQPRDDRYGNKKYQILILQDEEENQVSVIMFGTDITQFKDMLAPFNTYLVSVVQVKEPTLEYKSALNDYIWTFDRSTIVEPIEKVTPLEDPLPQPTRLTLTTFDTFEYQPKEYEFDVLSIVINDSHPTKTTRGKRVQEFFIMEGQKKPTKLALWDSFIDHDGPKILNQTHTYPAVLARRVSQETIGSTNRFNGLSNKFNTTIEIDPLYP
ncbi:putative protein isoform X1 [Capsicum chacoense]